MSNNKAYLDIAKNGLEACRAARKSGIDAAEAALRNIKSSSIDKYDIIGRLLRTKKKKYQQGGEMIKDAVDSLRTIKKG